MSDANGSNQAERSGIVCVLWRVVKLEVEDSLGQGLKMARGERGGRQFRIQKMWAGAAVEERRGCVNAADVDLEQLHREARDP